MTPLEKTIAAYEKAIESGDFDPWGGYGSSDDCILCQAYGGFCNRCPLGPEPTGCCDTTHDALRDALDDGKATVELFQVRLNWIKEKTNA